MVRHRGPREAISAPPATLASHRSAPGSPRGRLLGNGRYRALVTESGTGGAWLDGQALTLWRGDPVEDADGWFLYLRDLADGTFWSLADRPVPGAPGAHDGEHGPGWLAIGRRQSGIASRMEVWVDAERAAECRRVTLQNLTDRPRTIELTSYLEVVLLDARHHASHPAFSKLFVQTAWLPDRELLLAWRRPRDPGQRHPWLAHAARARGALG
ncbi:hypothetical protein, partial [Actinokineospora sp.]|uniref:hypothetical protein n=1 Tax=Actinokineospora sp. TaxID=1872133 RepID=UPI003D6AA128